MAGGFSFGGTTAASLGLTLLESPIPALATLREREASIEGKHGEYDFGTEFGRRELRLQCLLVGTSASDLWAKMDTLAKTLDPRQAYQQLIFDFMASRYYLARVSAIPELQKFSPRKGHMELSFKVKDAFAYGTSLVQSSHTITVDPQSVSESVGGNAPAEPEYQLTCGSAISGGTVVVNNATSDLSLSWGGTLAAGDVLAIKLANWVCERNGTVVMANVSGQFPALRGGTANSITVSGFRGTAVIEYRSRWL